MNKFMAPAKTWKALLGLHPVIRRARGLHFSRLEQQRLLRYLEQAGTFLPEALDVWRAPVVRDPRQLMGLSLRIAELLDQIAQIESGFSPERKEELLSGAFSLLTEISGLQQASIRGLFTDLRWTTPDLRTVMTSGGMSAPQRQANLDEVQSRARRCLLARVAKRLTHDLLIHGNSLRIFYQTLPLLRETIDRGNPGLTDLYIGFAATIQLQMMLYNGPYLAGAAMRAGRVEVGIQQGAFRIRASGINFPSLFNEIIKGLYEALLHSGMPTAAELGADEALFREMTSGPDLEYELLKVAPQASLLMHRGLVACRERDPDRISRVLGRVGYESLLPQGEVSMLYRAFARLSPAKTTLFACRAMEETVGEASDAFLARQLIRNLEE